MAKLVDALDLKSNGVTRAGSIPAARTTNAVYPNLALVGQHELRVWIAIEVYSR